jgi:hypothetical protein
MSGQRLKLIVLLIVACTAVASPLLLDRRSEMRWRDRRASLQEQARQLGQLTKENERLSNLVGIAQSRTSLLSDPSHELLRLRGEIGQLRRLIADLDSDAGKEKSSAPERVTEVDPTNSLPDPQTILAYWPRAQLGLAGSSDPASALKTVLWAMTQGDTNTLLANVTPEVLARMTKEGWDQRKDPATEIAESTKNIAESLNPSTGFYLVGQNLKSNDFAILDVHFEGEGKTRKFAMKRIGNEWKFAAMGRAGRPDEDLEGSAAWP